MTELFDMQGAFNQASLRLDAGVPERAVLHAAGPPARALRQHRRGGARPPALHQDRQRRTGAAQGHGHGAAGHLPGCGHVHPQRGAQPPGGHAAQPDRRAQGPGLHRRCHRVALHPAGAGHRGAGRGGGPGPEPADRPRHAQPVRRGVPLQPPGLRHRHHWLVLLSAAIAGLAAAAGTWTAIHAVVRLRPAQAMLPPAPPAYTATLVERLGLGRFLSTSARMVVRNLERRPLRAVPSPSPASRWRWRCRSRAPSGSTPSPTSWTCSSARCSRATCWSTSTARCP